jgi:hypothetical protein
LLWIKTGIARQLWRKFWISNFKHICPMVHEFILGHKQMSNRQTWPPHMAFYSLIHGALPFLRSPHLCGHSRTSQHLWYPKVDYHVHKSPPLVPILSQINPTHTIPSYLSKIHLIYGTLLYFVNKNNYIPLLLIKFVSSFSWLQSSSI